MKRAVTIAALAMALSIPAARAATETIPGYRSNYTVTANPDGSVTVVRLRDGAVQQLAAGTTTVKVMDDFVSFDVAGLPGQAFRVYQAAFNRLPDQRGLGYWIDALERGVSLYTVAGDFYQSAEFQATYGAVTDAQFLTQLYSNILHRAPDQGGYDYWLGVLKQGGARATLLHDFSESSENKATTAGAVANGIAYTPWNGSDVAGALQDFAPPVTPAAASQPLATTLSAADAVGAYQRVPVQNGFHSGTIGLQPGTAGTLVWKNDSGVSWTLTPDFAHGRLLTDSSNPYQATAPNFYLALVGGKIAGFYFQDELYLLNGTPIAAGVTPNRSYPNEDPNGMHGYLAHRIPAVPAGYDYGFSLYVAIWPLVDHTMDYYQAGLGTWVIPDNLSYDKALLPPDNAMRQSTPAGAPNWANLFQTIEGGMGNWGSTQYPVRQPKFAIAGTIDGYAHMMNSPGWGFASKQALTPDLMSIAQLSNRLLVPPDGFTFRDGTAGEFLGYAWMALPLTDAWQASVPVGDHSWTLFFNSTNFSGPVAFWVPDAWTRLSQSWANATARGLDTLSARADSSAIEFGTIPTYHNGDANGNFYLRIPRISFPLDASDTTWLAADRATYSSAALFDPMRSWFQGGASVSGAFARGGAYNVTMNEPSFGLTYGALEAAHFERYLSPVVLTTPGGGSAFGVKWTRLASAGVLPEYYKQVGTALEPIDAADVPTETMLGDGEFKAPSGRGAAYTSPDSGSYSWKSPAPAAGPFQATLNDGSVVTYFWYKFIDQPALQGYAWSAAQKLALQQRVEQIHRGWAGTREFMAPPTAGALVTLDSGLLVTPPAGLEVGYVPIVTAQAPQ
jgi:hypothetical protein